MSETLKTPATFIAWEANPLLCRDQITVGEDTKRGDILIYTSDGFIPYKDRETTPDSSSKEGTIIAIALADGKASTIIPVIARCAVILYDQLNHTKEDDFTNNKPCENFKDLAEKQQLVFRNSITPDWSA